MTGAGSLIAGNYMYKRAKPDGLTVGVWNSAMVLRQALGDRGVQFDARKMGWIGTPSVGLPSCGVMGFAGLKTVGGQGYPPAYAGHEGRQAREILNAWLQQYNFQRPMSLPPGTPEEQVGILRKALEAALKDPELLAEAKKSKLIITYVSGEQIEKYVDQILSMSPETRESLGFLVKGRKKKS